MGAVIGHKCGNSPPLHKDADSSQIVLASGRHQSQCVITMKNKNSNLHRTTSTADLKGAIHLYLLNRGSLKPEAAELIRFNAHNVARELISRIGDNPYSAEALAN